MCVMVCVRDYVFGVQMCERVHAQSCSDARLDRVWLAGTGRAQTCTHPAHACQGHRLTLAGAWLLWAAPTPWPYLTGVEGLPTVTSPSFPLPWHMGADQQGENSALPRLAQKSHRW